MLWCQGAQNIGLSNHKLKSALTCLHAPYDHNARPSQTDRRTNIMAIARRFVLTSASRAKNRLKTFRVILFTDKHEAHKQTNKQRDTSENTASLAGVYYNKQPDSSPDSILTDISSASSSSVWCIIITHAALLHLILGRLLTT